MGVERRTFDDPHRVAILPMGFCFPGSGRSGDLPPRPECAETWRAQLLEHWSRVKLTLVIGGYAQAWHLPDAGDSVTEVVRGWRDHWPAVVPLPHPSPRNRIWLARNPWFEAELVPRLRARIEKVMA